MNVRATRHPNAIVLRLEGVDALDCSCADAVKTAALCHLDGRADLVIDLSAVEFLDSAGVAVLVRLVRAARLNGSDVVFAGARSGVLTVLELIRLDRIFRLRPDVPDALRHLDRQRLRRTGP
jgi:anti-sigma B factor antagonist